MAWRGGGSRARGRWMGLLPAVSLPPLGCSWHDGCVCRPNNDDTGRASDAAIARDWTWQPWSDIEAGTKKQSEYLTLSEGKSGEGLVLERVRQSPCAMMADVAGRDLEFLQGAYRASSSNGCCMGPSDGCRRNRRRQRRPMRAHRWDQDTGTC